MEFFRAMLQQGKIKFHYKKEYKIYVFWDITPLRPLKFIRRFGGLYLLAASSWFLA
jgi:type IV secretory pathway VirB6-like protein